MNIIFRNNYITNNLTSKNTQKKIGTNLSNDLELKTNKLFLKTKTNSRNPNPNVISLQKKPKNDKLYLHTFNNNNKNAINIFNSYKNILKNNITNKKIKLIIKSNHNKKKFSSINSLSNTASNKSLTCNSNENNKFFLTDSNFYQNNKGGNTKNKIPISTLFKPKNNNRKESNENCNLYESSENIILNKRYSVNQILNNKKNIVINKRYSVNNISNNKNNIRKSLIRYYSNDMSQRHSINSVMSNPDLKDKVSQLIKEINNHKVDIKNYEKGNDISIKKSKKIKLNNKNKNIDSLAKNNRNKFFNLLNKDGNLNSFLKTMKFKKNNNNNIFKFSPKENKILIRPKNTVEMNNLLINSFALNKGGSNEFSKKLYSLNETFFSIMNEMKIAKAEMELEKLNNNNLNTAANIEAIKNREKRWEKKFLLNMYNNKLSEKEFKMFKKMNKIQRKKEIIKDSQQLADNIMKMDAKEYELPDDLYEFRSTKSFVSNMNVYRIRRVKRIMKNIEDKEQLGAYDVNVEKLKENQKKSAEETMLAIKRSGKPRFVKTQFKPSTITKYKEISGEFFGLPA